MSLMKAVYVDPQLKISIQDRPIPIPQRYSSLLLFLRILNEVLIAVAKS